MRSSGCCSKPAACRAAAGRVRRPRASMRAATPTIPALGPVQGRHSPPIGRQRAARRPSRPHSGPLTAFQTQGDTQGTPRNPAKCPSKPFPTTADTADAARSATPAPTWTSNRRPRRVRSSGCCSKPAACRAAAGRVAARAPACAPLRRRSRHSDPFRAGIHRRLAGSRPLGGVRVGLIAAP